MRHTMSAGGVVLNRISGRVVLVNQHGTSWSLPKGHLHPGEDNLSAAKREIQEETGISSLELVDDLGSYERYRVDPAGGLDHTELKTIAMFLFSTDQHTLAPSDPENPQALWVEPEEVPNLLTHPRDQTFFRGIMHLVKR